MNIVTGPIKGLVQDLIGRANTGMLRANQLMDNTAYQKTCDVYHMDTHTSIALTRDNLMGSMYAWHVSISFRDDTHRTIATFLPEIADIWLKEIFGTAFSRLVRMPGVTSPNIRHFLLICQGQFIELPEQAKAAS